MSTFNFHDISQWQGLYDMNDGCPAIAIKMSGGDAGLYYDSKASHNYQNAVNAGKVVIGYHFAGGNDPIAEADFFIRSMSPLAEGDILALDWEVRHTDPVNWCLAFVNRVHDSTGVWPLLYMNTSTAHSYDWSPVLANCGFWQANYGVSPDADIAGAPYIIQQFQGGPLDTNACFIPLESLRAYGYHPVPTPTRPPAPVDIPPTPTPAPIEALPPIEPPQPVPDTVSTTTINTPPTVSSPPPRSPAVGSPWTRFLAWLYKVFIGKKG